MARNLNSGLSYHITTVLIMRVTSTVKVNWRYYKTFVVFNFSSGPRNIFLKFPFLDGAV